MAAEAAGWQEIEDNGHGWPQGWRNVQRWSMWIVAHLHGFTKIDELCSLEKWIII